MGSEQLLLYCVKDDKLPSFFPYFQKKYKSKYKSRKTKVGKHITKKDDIMTFYRRKTDET